MSPVELDRLLQDCDSSRREFLKTLILGTAYATPLLTSFGMGGLGVDSAEAQIDGLCPNISYGNLFEDSGAFNSTDLVITKTASPDPVGPGELLTFTIQVYACNFDASNVVVSDQLPVGTVFVSSAQTGGPMVFTLNEPPVDSEAGLWSATAPVLVIRTTATFEVVVRVMP